MPDAREDIDNPAALKKYYELLLSVLRLISSVVLSRGPQNERTLEQGRRFLSANRSSMVGIFKRSAKIGGQQAGVGEELDELVEHFVLLITMTRFLDASPPLLMLHDENGARLTMIQFEDADTLPMARPKVFT